MTTQKRMTVPIFNYKLVIVIYDKWDEIKHLDPSGDGNTVAGFTKYQHGSAIVAIQSNHGSSIVHEAEHVKNLIWEFIGYRPQADNDEVDAYLLTYLYNKITDVFYKHDKAAK